MYMFVCLFVFLKPIITNCISVYKHHDVIIIKFLVKVYHIVKITETCRIDQWDPTLQVALNTRQSKSKVELEPYLIKCLLNDIVIISAPEIYKSAEYYLYRPNGDYIKLDIPRKNTKRRHINEINITIKRSTKNINDQNMYRIINIYNDDSRDILKGYEESMGANEFMIGPLLPEDHGNWVLSVFVKDIDNEYLEFFQVITIEINETIELNTGSMITLNEGDTLNLRFIYPISNLETCQLLAPNTTYDRLFDRSLVNMNHCGFIVPNMTEVDSGFWGIIGLGKMVYRGEVYVHVTGNKKHGSSKI